MGKEARKKNFKIEFKNPIQKMAYSAFEKHDILFLLGAAGTGKTFLSCAFAISEILADKRERLILTRPIVEAGENLGYLPGTFEEKVDPYMMPIYDCLNKLLGKDGPQREKINRAIEIAPLAYLRGRAQPLDAEVVTPQGIKKMGEITVGSYVTGVDKKVLVKEIHPQGMKEVWKLTFNDETVVESTEDHLWSVDNRGKKVLKTTKEIVDNLNNKNAYFFPMAKAAIWEKQQRIKDNPYEVGTKLESLGKIPPEYLFNTIEVRQNLLSGFLDENSTFKRSSILYYTYNLALAKEIVQLVRGLGGVALCKLIYKRYELKIIIPFNPYKKSKHIERYRDKYFLKQVIAAEKVGEKECQCLTVDGGLYLTNGFTVTHNCLSNAVCLLDEAQNANFGQLKLFLTRMGENSKIIITGDNNQSDLPKGSADFVHVVNRLKPVQGIAVIEFNNSCIVRHPLVGKILEKLE